MTDTSTLETLTDTTCDSVKGYRKAAEKADSAQLKQALEQRAQQRQQTLDALNAELQRQGAEPVTDGTASGGLHRLWVDITEAFERGDEAAASRVEEGEAYLKGKFEAALDEDNLDPQQRSVIQQCYAEISEGASFGDMIEKQYG